MTPPSTLSPRPFLKWAGGKAKLIAQYADFIPQEFVTYHEPFLGGGALFFYLAPRLKSAYLSDLNPELVNVYRCVRDQVDAVLDCLAVHQQRHRPDYYYAMRAQTDLAPAPRAARLLYLNRTCYNGLYRENSKGQFNVPMGRYKNPKICNPPLLKAASQALQIAEIDVRPFTRVLNDAHSRRDFVYFDPPYYPISPTSSFTAYSRYRFAADQQRQLQQVFASLAQRQVQMLLSNSDCDFIRQLYADFSIQSITAARAINSHADRRGKISEVLVVFPEPAASGRNPAGPLLQ
ncbi:DNA adenine methylase [Romeria aff. gracilis LEGE 07310]|uniref:Site-specific DNA-methyltransferase (adenine-specific) n=1 Tax=Vasconcelosia minhoensis LEGE 07310 TaxID=915328 RepID=A0A8J7DK42_9CYAN|nr:DNA adenine methylase [Romeria gracilis]MBE9075921.1 DNA adenine methylase [Romeria aff. gracilis LEGE 07310]